MTGGTDGADAPMSFADYARRRGCSRPYISKKVADGTIHGAALTPDRRIIPSLADAQLEAAADPAHAAPLLASSDVSYARERARREAAMAERAEIELRARKGELLARKDVDAAVADAFAEVKNRLLSIPIDHAAELVRIHDELAMEARLPAAACAGPCRPD